ncbi:hypothetical protein AB0M61_01710 [Streptomyces sp. NPDC051642]|uniref:hypothetical protein n=1 Tax=Streptomyces sp. NPDC051642 TaxID=3154646 RepID=UPI00341F1B8F
MQATDLRLQQHHPVLPGPSYARQVIDQIADLIGLASPDSLITEVGLNRMYTVAVAAQLHELPTNVADEVAERVDKLLPPLRSGITCGEYAPLLRTLATAV